MTNYRKHYTAKYTNGTSRTGEGVTLYGCIVNDNSTQNGRPVEMTVATADIDGLVTMLASWVGTPIENYNRHQMHTVSNANGAEWLRKIATELEQRPY